MKDLIINAVLHFIGTMSFFAISYLIAFISFNALVSTTGTNKFLAVVMLVLSLGFFTFAYCICRDSLDSWSEDYKRYKKWND